ncbi:hypothetical protein E2C01_042025 [Portunus trituberculatus]|uniref:Uncharacterized protein n=1 Tax=Portunus trituberculatus TaxID=210409 RepID=A0A5B7FS98_PORTR|nr:hypothetical protein [Portunus trituberculatus]
MRLGSEEPNGENKIYISCPILYVLYDIAINQPFGCYASIASQSSVTAKSQPPRKSLRLSPGSGADICPSWTIEVEDSLCSAVVQKILPVLVKAMANEKGLAQGPTGGYAYSNLAQGDGGVVDEVVRMGLGRRPSVGSNPTTYRFEAMPFIK